MTVTYPAFASNAIIDPAQINTNNADLSNQTRGLTSANLAAAAAIVSAQLADRFGVFMVGPVELVPFTSNADLQTPANFNVPDTTAAPGTEIKRLSLVLRTGKAAYLLAWTFRCVAETQVGGADVAAWLTVNGIVLGGGAAIVNAANTDFNLRNATPYDNPLRSLANGDYISIGLGRNNAGGRPTCRGLYGFGFVKCELGA